MMGNPDMMVGRILMFMWSFGPKLANSQIFGLLPEAAKDILGLGEAQLDRCAARGLPLGPLHN